jgi:hypothetical protein
MQTDSLMKKVIKHILNATALVEITCLFRSHTPEPQLILENASGEAA